MFKVIYCQDKEYGSYRVLGRAETLEEAAAMRKVSGDIVIDDDDKVVTDRSWLWGWETQGALLSKRSYALRQIHWQENNPTWSFLWHKQEVK